MRRAVIAAVVVWSVVACGGRSRQSTAGDNTARMNPSAPPTQESPSKPVGAAEEIRVDLLEYEIHMPDVLRAGPQSLLVTNAGKENHSLAIEGNGVNVQLPQQLTRGDSTTLAVDLKPGTYAVYCPVDGHKGKGMTRTLTVR